MNPLNDISKIITARVSVPVSTPSSVPYSVKITSPLAILESVKVAFYSVAAGTTPIDTGWKLSNGGELIIPSMGSFDSLTNETYCPAADVAAGGFVELGELNKILDGPPYELNFNFYNIDTVRTAYYLIFVKVGAKVELPIAPVTSDVKDVPDNS